MERTYEGGFNVYTKKTSNLLSNMDLPHSNGFASYVDNVGEVKNNGWEASASVYVIRNAERDINWIIGGQLTYNKNYISKLSEAIKAQNEAYLKEDVMSPICFMKDVRKTVFMSFVLWESIRQRTGDFFG